MNDAIKRLIVDCIELNVQAKKDCDTKLWDLIMETLGMAEKKRRIKLVNMAGSGHMIKIKIKYDNDIYTFTVRKEEIE